jgi:hypothetical protein
MHHMLLEDPVAIGPFVEITTTMRRCMTWKNVQGLAPAMCNRKR